ncbi:unnamed protein product [Camellia sinensis]
MSMQYAVAATLATLEKDKNDMLRKLLLQGWWVLSCEIGKGKVGSGFDVSSAVYSSQRYVRFSPKVLSSAQDVVKGKALEEVIGDVLNGKWDHARTTQKRIYCFFHRVCYILNPLVVGLKHFGDKVIVEEQVERMMSDYAVEPISDGISEFNVEFHGPKENVAEGIVDMIVQ